MTHLVCVEHGRRSQVILNHREARVKTIHRSDGSECKFKDVSINGKPITRVSIVRHERPGLDFQHEWMIMGFVFGSWIECKCGFRPTDQEDMSYHENMELPSFNPASRIKFEDV